jgi:heme iron utilization protein
MSDLNRLAIEVRELMAGAARAYLGSLARRGSETFPFVSLVLPALDGAGRPLLLLSDLSDHARNLQADPRASLLYDGTFGLKEPLTGPRVTLIGSVAPAESAENRRAYLARQPSAETYAGFGDFRLYRFDPAEALFVAGFGRIHRLGPDDLFPAL